MSNYRPYAVRDFNVVGHGIHVWVPWLLWGLQNGSCVGRTLMIVKGLGFMV